MVLMFFLASSFLQLSLFSIEPFCALLSSLFVVPQAVLLPAVVVDLPLKCLTLRRLCLFPFFQFPLLELAVLLPFVCLRPAVFFLFRPASGILLFLFSS